MPPPDASSVSSTAAIRYSEELGGLSAADLVGFWEGWPTRPSPERHLRALRGSEIAILAIDDVAGRVVGFVTAVGDGELAAFVPFLEVLPAYRGRGIGRELLRRALERLDGRYSVDLVCDDELVPFYERLGFTRLAAMAIRDRDALAADGPPG
jgi:ribosomal protein S18 acetylase RimI-like enzyme